MTNHLRRVLPALFALLIAVTGILVAPAVAHAAEDEVSNLDVTFDVRADGSVGVRYEIHWRFAETGRHGIDFGIATREAWDQDPGKDVVYEVTNLTVDSPSGAPDEFERTDHEAGSTGEIQLRIGDPAIALDTRDVTYVITYDLGGALRTFDGVPEFHWDVSSGTYPRVQDFSVTVTGPDGVDRARCLAGYTECEQSVTNGIATLTGSDVPSGVPITAVAALPAGSVINAEPRLEERRLSSPQVSSQDSRFVIDETGSTRVEHTIAYRFPQGQTDPERFTYKIPTRLPHSFTKDRLFAVTDIGATDGTGTDNPTRISPGRDDGSAQHTRVDVTVTPVDDVATVVLQYKVVGAVGAEGGSDAATFTWPITHEFLYAADSVSLEWEVPERVRNVGCSSIDHEGKESGDCKLNGAATIDGRTITLETSKFKPEPDRSFLVVTVPAGSVGGAKLDLEPSKDLGMVLDLVGGAAGALVAFVGMILGIGRAGGLLQRKDHRFTGVPPGVSDVGGAVAASNRKAMVPVQFHPPDLDLASAGIILDGTFNARHTAAALTQLAVDGAVELRTKPLQVVRANRARADGPVGYAVYNAVPKKPGKRLEAEQVRKMNRAVNSAQKLDLADRSLFRGTTGGCGIRLLFMLAFMLVVPAAALWVALFGPRDLSLTWTFALMGLAAGSFFGSFFGLASSGSRAPLAPGGTALRDQIRGFEQYIATAEADQIDFEAEQDIFRRYLPWAVLFGLTKRWTKACEELAAAGLIPPLDTAFAGGVTTAELTRSLSSLQARSSSAGLTSPSSSSGSSSSGGSGGSSGFSSGSSGGSGGGGTSASSW